MTRFSHISWLTATLLALAISQPARALTIVDNYEGSDDNGFGDVIGSTADFEIFSMDATVTDNTLAVSIYTNFAGKGDAGLFSGITGGDGIGYGDLFLSSSWTPDGLAPHETDDASTGTVWEYGFSLEDRWASDGGGAVTDLAGTLYSLNSGDNNTDALLSGDFLTGGTYRDGQEVAVDTCDPSDAACNADVTALTNTGSWGIDTANKLITFTIDLSGTSLADSSQIALHWGMTCANDVIEGEIPAPVILLLMATGLLGVGVTTAVKRKRA